MNHDWYMRRCLKLAENGLGTTSPNPLVGSVIVHEDRVIGEGWHFKAGAPHAEVNAINSVKDQSLLSQSTIYVNLEPCAHHGRTPPCSDLIIENKIPRVVIGSRDPFSEVDGKGIAKMENAGISVTTGVLEEECKWLNRRFFTFHNKKRPYIILKWAQSADGFMDRIRKADETGVNWITQKESKTLVHHWRAMEDGILVGAQTVINDNPDLTVREVSGHNPVRIVLNSGKEIPTTSKIFDGTVPTLLFTDSDNSSSDGVEIINLGHNDETLSVLLKECFDREIQSILVEGGSTVLSLFLESGNWDEARVFTGTPVFGDGLKSPVPNGHLKEVQKVGLDQLNIYLP